jgi:hypothetical protein
MRKFAQAAALIASCFTLAFSGNALADAITTFDVSGLFNTSGGPGNGECDGCSLGGTITIDVTTGSITSADITLTGQSAGPFTNVGSVNSSTFTFVQLFDASSDRLDLDINTATFVGYTGGSICGEPFGNSCEGGAFTQIYATDARWDLASGSLIAEAGAPTVTPLPAALPLFATGLGAMGLLGWRRKRKAAAAIAA